MTSHAETVDAVMRERRTVRMEAPQNAPTPGEVERGEIDAVLASAGFAPFHHAASGDPVEPWRCHVLDAEACRRLRRLAQDAGGRVPRMLATAEALIVVTWLPQGAFERGPRVRFDGTLVNMEHVAAVGAMIQNVLLAATARRLPTYWSSGGWLATDAGLDAVGAGAEELLLGAVFLFPRTLPDGATTSPGKHHEKRRPGSAWTRWVEADAVGRRA